MVHLSKSPGLPCGSAGKESACNAGDLSSISGLGRCPGEEKSYPLQYSGLDNSMDYTVHVAKSQTRLSDFLLHVKVPSGCQLAKSIAQLSVPISVISSAAFAELSLLPSPSGTFFTCLQGHHTFLVCSFLLISREVSKYDFHSCLPSASSQIKCFCPSTCSRKTLAVTIYSPFLPPHYLIH